MSGGEQQMLAMARALMARPKLVLLDEPSLGLAPLVTQELFRTLGDLNRDDGLSMLVVEQNAGLALELAARGTCSRPARSSTVGYRGRPRRQRRRAPRVPGDLMSLFLTQLMNGIGSGAVYASIALALVLVFRTTGILNFAQGEMALVLDVPRVVLHRNAACRCGSRSSWRWRSRSSGGAVDRAHRHPAGRAGVAARVS